MSVEHGVPSAAMNRNGSEGRRVLVAAPTIHRQPDAYGHARLPASAHDTAPERVDKIPYGRFRNVYLSITEAFNLTMKKIKAVLRTTSSSGC